MFIPWHLNQQRNDHRTPSSSDSGVLIHLRGQSEALRFTEHKIINFIMPHKRGDIIPVCRVELYTVWLHETGCHFELCLFCLSYRHTTYRAQTVSAQSASQSWFSNPIITGCTSAGNENYSSDWSAGYTIPAFTLMHTFLMRCCCIALLLRLTGLLESSSISIHWFKRHMYFWALL